MTSTAPVLGATGAAETRSTAPAAPRTKEYKQENPRYLRSMAMLCHERGFPVLGRAYAFLVSLEVG